MNKIGIFFGTDSGTTRLMAKKMAKILGDIASKPLNVNRISIDEMLQYDSLILGTPSYGEGQLPGLSLGIKGGSWEEFIPQLEGADLSGKRIALYGLGNQDKYSDRFADSLFCLYEKLCALGAVPIGRWPVEGYTFEHSQAVVDGKFVGLILDQQNQALLSDSRMNSWLEQIGPELTGNLPLDEPLLATPEL